MKIVIAFVAALAMVAPVLAWIFIDGPTGAMFTAATVLVCVCAAMPVVFSVVTRRRDRLRLERDEAEVIGRDGPASAAGAGTDQK